METEADVLRVYCPYLSTLFRCVKGEAREEGYGVVLNKLQRLMAALRYVRNGDLAYLARLYEVQHGLMIQLGRSELCQRVFPRIADGLGIEDDLKFGLKLCLSNVDVDDLTGEGGYSIEAGKVAEKIPLVSEIPPDEREKLIIAMRKAYMRELTADGADRLETLLEALAGRLDDCDIQGALDHLIAQQKEICLTINRLHSSDTC